MTRQPIVQRLLATPTWKLVWLPAIVLFGHAGVCVVAEHAAAQTRPQPTTNERASTQPSVAQSENRPVDNPSKRQAELDAALVEMLSGATLEGSFTSTGAGRDSTKLSREKYTLGNVKRLAGNFWLIPARIEYGEHDLTLPITVPIEWAGDTPIVVVDNIPLPVFGTVSARVMFFADHYAGYWKHGDHGGHLFGVIRRDEQQVAPSTAPTEDTPSVEEPSASQKPND